MSLSRGPWTSPPGGDDVWGADGEWIANVDSADDARAIAKVPEMVEMLRELEWAGTPEGGGKRRCCPECDESGEHYPDCKLAALLKDLP